MADAISSFTKGFGSTAAGVGILIALGAMFGKLLADSGGADEIVDIVGRSSPRTLPWAMGVVGAGKLVADWVQNSGLSVLLLAWLIAVLIRLATGSATVATVTASGILALLVTTLGTGQTALLVLAIGAGSLFFSHVNDAGFWLVKEYFGLSVGQTIKTWSLMETVLSVAGLAFTLALSLFL
ncbi:hypothetical protein [Nonomuraea sp. NPDC049784]|uniref:GntT/GntP/DsdX family permease n=1 Tax=Nonomuraea sp. NPDC049784 TaxID=3154361 RepID=UPI00340E0623